MIAWFLGIALSAAAEPPSPTLDEVLLSVERHLPLLLAAEAEVEAARGRRMVAAGAFDPAASANGWYKQGPYDQGYAEASLFQATPLWGLEVQAGWRTGVGDFATYDGWYDTLDQGEVFGALRLPLLKDGLTDARRTDIRVANAKLDAAQAKLAAKQVEVARKARETWWKWLATGEKLVIAEDMLAVAERQRQAIERRVERGDLPEIDLVDNRRVVVERQAKVIETKRDLDAAAFALGLYLRGPTGAPAPPSDLRPPPLPKPPDPGLPAVTDAVASALATRPEVFMVEADRRAAEAKVRLAQWSILPKLDLKVELRQDFGTPDEKVEPFDAKIGGELGFTLAQRPSRGKLGEARADLTATDAALTWVRDSVNAEVRTAWTIVQAAHAAALLADEQTDLAEQLEEATRRRYELGDTDLFSVYLREQSRMKAAMDRIDAWATYQLAEAALKATMGER